MSNFFNAMTTNDSYTNNGAVTHSTSSSACLDLFFLIGASRGQNLNNLVSKAFSESPELTTRILLWSRDIRQGAGERQHMKNFITYLEESNKLELAEKVIKLLPELGRWDDMLVVKSKELREVVSNLIKTALYNNDGLCAKWMPRENSAKRDIALWLMKHMNMPPKTYRKILAKTTKVIETNLCNKDYSFNYSHVPSKAMSKYVKAFYRNDEERFEKYKQALIKGKTKINAGAIYPNEVLCLPDRIISAQMWKALPNFLDNSKGSILPVCDVSGSMGGLNVRHALSVSIGLGLYIAQRNTGPFKDMVMTFCGQPTLYKVSSLENTTDLYQEARRMQSAAPDMSTNLQGVFDLFLSNLINKKCTEEEMPKTLLIISDMEFNSVNNISNFEAIKRKYALAGFKVPNLVFWNVYGREGNVPVKVHDENTALVSGYSPSIVKSVLGNKMNPIQIMLDTVMIDRYKY